MKKVLLAGVPKSPNLGDGLIAYTLNRIISMRGKHQVIHFDLLDGRCDQSMPIYAARGGLHYALAGPPSPAPVQGAPAPALKLNNAGSSKKMTPDALRRLKAYWIHRGKNEKLNRELKQAVGESEAVLIGGGHLLIDTYWTFPLAVRRVAEEAKRQGKPLHILLVGARGPWSAQAKRWLLGVCRYAASIAVRDEDSKRFLLGLDPKLASKTVTLADPALFTPEAFGLTEAAAGREKQTGKRTIGLGVMDPHEMNRHCELRWEREACADWWTQAAKVALGAGHSVSFFTNGAASDNAFVEEFVKPRLAGLKGIEFSPYPTTVEQLVGTIASCDSVIAQRLHACIPSLAMGKPTYGLIWDRKLENIFADLGMKSQLIDFRESRQQLAAAVDGRMVESGPAIDEKKLQLYEHIGRILQ
ncbi:polysaccharide pyruvyl transferase family protein [Paenibacillus glycanilyticus]|uniref:polysaccharide pyruvyl transferase family protein n=1 Tax=Paenibacillus glycanilyticus TaxID=126569 RepID=UPI002040F806|nr:polysaccharide pyruvyl transferase family protein [Paenibacillus glycanilyticus]MCM3630288.1 polysaccharide pyruvyl transferase family protein [Paenibacillus glycanilyticus]